jgi:hypothetical protein
MQKLDYKALISGNWVFNYLKYPVRNMLRKIHTRIRTFYVETMNLTLIQCITDYSHNKSSNT